MLANPNPQRDVMTTGQTEISVARDFSRFPAGRFRADGPFPGERFRDELLVPALSRGGRVLVNLDGTLGFGSSFLEEAFGGLVRLRGFTAEKLKTTLVLKASDSSLELEIWEYISKAELAKGK
jgi:hypothetical protein